ncbi:ParM/StbA family protein [Allochromatium tepidum]|uniref:Actin-like protein N-terminal domain-containing protein n=1 Tax=Allochromatium tepidum TaxID=553982 RepID=A0ABM7QR02_9GAMM|nr:ParM/StbA family protein [Allochromatium tepidum]BCU08340.1 hypothetical protein Atep_30170 [Allochromatium tepidum]
MQTVVVGLDLGHSAVKMTFDGKKGVERALFPSYACDAWNIDGDDHQAALAAENTVTVNGRDYFVGEIAERQGKSKLSTGLTDEWVLSNEHAALMVMARKIVDERAISGKRLWVLGLPVSLFSGYRRPLKDIAQLHFGDDSEIRIVPQPIGVYQAQMLNRAGVPGRGRDVTSESWGIVDVGYYTTDFILMERGHWIDAASGVCGGVQIAVETLQGLLLDRHNIKRDLISSERILRSGFVRHMGNDISLADEIKYAKSVFAAHVADMASKLMKDYVEELDGVLIAGGGAEMVIDPLRERWPHARVITDSHDDNQLSGPRFSISEGYYRLGRFTTLLHLQGKTDKAA